VHSYYSSRQPSGENVIVDLQVEALRRAGHEVGVIARRTDALEQHRLYPLQAGLRVATGRGASPETEIGRFAPDVVHVHNLFPNFGRAWVRRVGVPVVATLHNYRPICPAGTLFRDGAACTLCPDARSARPALTHRCYKDSTVATAPVVLGTRFAADPVLASARRIITLNDDMRRAYAAVGVPEERLLTVPNFVASAATGGRHDGGFWVFVGRLSEEKGVLPLVRDWPVGPRLKVVGSGPLEEAVRASAGPTVELVGHLPHAEVRSLLGAARGLVFPSLWPEGLPTVYLEALAAGLPVLASPESVVGSLVAADGTGLVRSSSIGDDLARIERDFDALQRRCRAVFEARYTEDAWVESMVQVYRSLLEVA
jgi:glycosyltransferase involved in cell wall biosynthesis